MKIENDKVTFEYGDMSFVEKFGIMEATKMVLDYKSFNATPFIYDTHQLADTLGVSSKELFALIKHKKEHYRKVTLTKKNGKIRKINAPDFDLSCVQYWVLHDILNHIPISEFATAYHKGSTLYDNAKPHTNKKYMLKLDITDFFGSITFEDVLSSAFNSSRYPKQIGYLLTEICTLDGVVPQGAPTSPAISNIVMKRFDDRIGEWCKKREISYTRYCDDMTFSADKPLYNVYKKVEQMLNDMGFWLNEKKTKFVSSSSRQTVTGLVVNEKVSVPREYKRELRQKIHYIEKYGFDPKVCRSLDGEKLHNMYFILMGKIGYVLQIEPENEFFKTAIEKLPQIAKNCGL